MPPRPPLAETPALGHEAPTVQFAPVAELRPHPPTELPAPQEANLQPAETQPAWPTVDQDPASVARARIERAAGHQAAMTNRRAGFVVKRVGEQDPRYQAELDKLPEIADQIYGADLLVRIDHAGSDPAERDLALQDLAQSQTNLIERAQQYPQRVGSELIPELMAIMPDPPSPSAAPAELLQDLSLPDYERLLRHHVETANRHIADLQERIGPAVESFKHRLAAAIQNGLPLDPKLADQRLARLRFTFNDSYAQPEHRGDTWGNGEYNYPILSTSLRHGLNPSELSEVVDHELLHALSGHLYRVWTRGGQTVEAERGSRRVGLSMASDRFLWLNEAVTESTTTELAGQDYTENIPQAEVYPWEQSLLAHLEAKVPRRLFQAAYFENFDPNDTTTPSAWGELQRRLADAFEPRILLKLDKIINEHPEGYEQGLIAASEYLSQNHFQDALAADHASSHATEASALPFRRWWHRLSRRAGSHQGHQGPHRRHGRRQSHKQAAA